MEFRNQKRNRGTKNPNNKMAYIRAENSILVGQFENFSGFVNFCLSQKSLIELFNRKVGE